MNRLDIECGDRDSVIDSVRLYHSQIFAGRCLAKDSSAEADLVVGVPESGNAAAQVHVKASVPPQEDI